MSSITEISERYVDELAVLDPCWAARALGLATNGTTLTDYSPDGIASRRGLYQRTLTALEAAEPHDEAERLGRLYLRDRCRGDLALIDGREHEQLMIVVGGPPALVRVAFDLMDRRTEADWAAVAERLAAVPAALAGYRAALEEGVRHRAVAARSTTLAVAEQCTAWGPAGGDWFSGFVAAYGDGPRRPALDAGARAATEAYGQLGRWLRTDYAARTREDGGVGGDRYRIWARVVLGTDIDLDEAYAWGWDELTRIERERAGECHRLLPGEPFEAVRAVLDTDPADRIEGVDAYRGWLQEVTDAAIDALHGSQFDIPGPLRTCLIGIPPEGSAAAPYYTPPSEDLAQPGRTWFPTLGRTTFPTWDQVTIAYHEAVPGHHLQLGTTRLTPLVRAHRLGFGFAHGEGWALYAERLMDELGFFDTPATRLGFLSSQAFRAVRIVIDIGLHTGRRIPAGWPDAGARWAPEVAVAYLRRYGALDPVFAASEVQRYLGWPAQAIGYKLGERVWLDGRRARQAEAGFDLRRWHANALALGALGLDDLAGELAAC